MQLTPAAPTPYDSSLAAPAVPTDSTRITSIQEIPEAPPQGIEKVMLAEDKLPVVLAVVLIIWFGLLFFLFRTDRRLARLEKAGKTRA